MYQLLKKFNAMVDRGTVSDVGRQVHWGVVIIMREAMDGFGSVEVFPRVIRWMFWPGLILQIGREIGYKS